MGILVARDLVENPEQKQWVDHKDGDKTNYKVNNLRWVTKSESQLNRSALKSKSLMKGVHFHKKDERWKSSIMVRGKRTFLGYFSSKEEAQAAYKGASRVLTNGYGYYESRTEF